MRRLTLALICVPPLLALGPLVFGRRRSAAQRDRRLTAGLGRPSDSRIAGRDGRQ